MNELTVEKAAPENASVLTALQREAFNTKMARYGLPPGNGPHGFADSEWQIKQMQENDYYAISWQGTIVGGCIVKNTSDECHIIRIFIGPEYQKRGFGKQGLSKIELLYPQAPVFTLDTPDWDDENHRFYEGLGYLRAGTAFHPDLDFSLYLYRKSGKGAGGRKFLFR